MSTLIVDNGESCSVKGLRVSEKHRGGSFVFSCLTNVGEWALSNGAYKYVGTNIDYTRTFAVPIMDMVSILYIHPVQR